jgi:cytochrome c556
MTSLRSVAVIIGAFGIVATTAFAQDVVKERQEIMKTHSAAGAKLGSQMLKGDVAYDGEKLAAAMTAISEVPELFLPLLKPGTMSNDNADSTAKPEILTSMADFKAQMENLKKASLDAAAAAKAGKEQFRVAFNALTKTCSGCHEQYRVKK